MLIEGKKIQERKFELIKKKVESLNFKPLFCDVMIGDDLVSKKYVELKEKMAESVGIGVVKCRLPISVSTKEVIEKIKELNKKPNMCGIIIQLPIPESLNKEEIVNTINPKLDIDCLTKENREKFYKNEAYFSYPTALATIDVLSQSKIDLKEKKICILGKGELVGKPVKHLLETKGYNVIVVDKDTTDKESIIKESDVVISATGVPNILNASMLKEGSVVIDVGTSESFGAVVGDVNKDGILEKTSFSALTPGGVGPVTIACLFENVIKAALGV